MTLCYNVDNWSLKIAGRQNIAGKTEVRVLIVSGRVQQALTYAHVRACVGVTPEPPLPPELGSTARGYFPDQLMGNSTQRSTNS